MKTACGICGTDCFGPGKFEGNECQTVARELYDILGEGGGDEECPIGCCALILGAVHPDQSPAYIAHSDSQGFFDYQSFASAKLARIAWDKDLAMCEAEMTEED